MLARKSWKVMSFVSMAMFGLGLMILGPSFSAEEDCGEVKLEMAGKTIAVEYGRPSTEGKAYKSMADGVPEGTLWRMGKNEATTLETDADLKFGEVTVKAGKYSLAAKKTAEGWDLLVHPNAKRWGSPVPEDGYVATIPLTVGEPKEASDLLTIRLREKEGKGTFVLVWGKQKLSTQFEIAQ